MTTIHRFLAVLCLLVINTTTLLAYPIDEDGVPIREKTLFPTATPTIPITLDVSSLVHKWTCYYGRCDITDELKRVLRCESGLQLYPRSGAAGEVGPAQFHPYGVWTGIKRAYPSEWGWLTFDALRDPETNIRLMTFAFIHGYEHHWSCY